MSSSRNPRQGSNSATFLALGALIGVGLGLLFLTALVLPNVVGLMAVVFGFFFFGVLQYMLWGWWLPRVVNKDDSAGDDDVSGR